MAEISFPINPANNEVYTVNGRYWRWDGVSWNSIINDNYGRALFNDNGNINTLPAGSNGQVLTSNGTAAYWGAAVGTSGYSGFSGISGYSGFSGISGYSGFSGVSGYSGFSGISGYSGFSGISGYSGFSGISGYSGSTNLSGLSNNYIPFYNTGTGNLTDSTITKSSSNSNIGINTLTPTATLEVAGTIKGQLQAYSETISVLGTITSNADLDTSLSNIFTLTLGANNLTLTFTNPPSSNISRPVTVVVAQDNTGSRFVTFANSKYTDGAVPVLSTGANSVDILTFFTVDGGANWYGSFAMANVS